MALRDGPLGWGTMRGRVKRPDGNEIGFRWTAVFRQENGVWKAVQIHGSIGVPDEQAFGAEPAA